MIKVYVVCFYINRLCYYNLVLKICCGVAKLDAIELYSFNGQLIKAFSKIGHSIDLENLKSGLYFIKVINGNKSQAFKVLKSE
ncbi:MAG: T9SS type A sorting domain-containing protein [Flavobacteriaceae bacterium]